jgi:H+/Cl- antiporter ClcA
MNKPHHVVLLAALVGAVTGLVVAGLDELVGRLVAAVATVGSGAPMGLEGPSLYAGATFGSKLQRRLPRVLREVDRRFLLVAGAAAGVAAIF